MKFNKSLNHFGKVAVLMGGNSQERDVSLKSGRSVLNSLLLSGVDAYPFDPRDEEIFLLKARGFNRVFNALHGGIGENGALQGALNVLGLPYTGDNVLASALGFDKVRSKMLWRQAGINVPNYFVIQEGDCLASSVEEIILRLQFPLFVKPAHNGSSIAVSKVYSQEELLNAIPIIWSQRDDALVEEAIEGEEYTYTLLQGVDLPLIRIVSPSNFYDYHAKYLSNDTKYFIPCGLDVTQEKAVINLCLKAFRILGCRYWGRIDFIIDSNGTCYFLEVNTSPGLTDHSLSPKAALAVGMNYSELVIQLLGQTLIF